jgi:malate permease and related proteins
MFKALESVLCLILMMGLGFVLTKRRWFDGAASLLISRLVVSVALPAYMIATIIGGYDRAKLFGMLPGLPVPFAVMLATYGLSAFVARILRLPEDRRGTFSSMFALSNTIFVGLPVNIILFGDRSLPYVLLYYIANTTLFWTIGVHGIARDGSLASGRAVPGLVSLGGLKQIFSPPFVAFLAASALVLLGFHLPQLLLDLCRGVGSMTTPLSMIFVGMTIASVEWRMVKPDWSMALVLAGRFLVSPCTIFLLMRWTGLPLLMKQVFLVQSSMPAMTQTPILAQHYGADPEYAGIMTSVTTVAGLITIPICMSIVGLMV